MKNSFIVHIIFLFFGASSFAQTPSFSFVNFKEKNGLFDKMIYDTTQDKQGFIWLGGSTGLYRFDGKEFRYFKSSADVPGHQISNILQSTFTDKDGMIWLASLNALQKFNPVTEKFSSFNYTNQSINQLVKKDINSFFRDSKGNLWITTQNNGWCLFNEKSVKTHYYQPASPFVNADSKKTYKIIETTNGKLWAVSFNGLFSFSAASTKVTSYFNLVNQKPLNNNFIDGFFDKKRNCIWLANWTNGIAKFDLNTNTFTHFPLIIDQGMKGEVHAISFVTQKDNDKFWFGGSVFGEFDCNTNKMVLHKNKENNEYDLNANTIHSLKKDAEGNLWIASASGLSLLSWQNNQVTNLPLVNPVTNLSIEPLGVVNLNNGDLLVANDTSNGLVYWDSKATKTAIIEIPFYKNNSKIISGIFAVHKTKAGTIYASEERGLYQYDEKNKQLDFIPLTDQNEKKIGVIDEIRSDENGNLYLTSPNNGFYFYKVKQGKSTHFNLWDVDKKASQNKEQNNISPKYLDRSNNLWFTLTDGVYCFEQKSKNYHHYAVGKSLNSGAQIQQSLDIVQDKNGNYWIATADNGLFELVIKNGKEKLYNYVKNDTTGLPSDYCYRLVCDEKGFLWVGTLNGLVKFDVNSKKVLSVLNQQNGLKNNNIDVPITLLENGKLVINNYGMLSIIDIRNYRTNRLTPKIVLTSITVLDKDLKATNTSELKLKYNENFIGFHWAALSYNNCNQNRFAYKLVGADANWIYTSDTKIAYSGLPNGEYVFSVKAANNDGVWSKERRLSITIAPPFWQAWWFYGLLIFVVGGIAYTFYTFKLNQVKKEEKLKTHYAQQIAEIEMKALRAQMNPHFIFNSLNSIQKYILKNDSFEASQYLTKFSKLIRLILDHSNQNYILLSSEIALLKLYIEIEDLRFDNKFEHVIIVDERIDAEAVEIPSMIIQPYIENAIWHGLLHKEDKGKLYLIIQLYDQNNIRVIVEDNGIGREKAEELKSKQVLKKKSYGLQITRDRISILNQTQSKKTTIQIIDLKDEKGKVVGTKIELIIPIQPSNKK